MALVVPIGYLDACAKSLAREMGLGLGAVGDGAHSPREHVVIRTMPERAALLAALLASF